VIWPEKYDPKTAAIYALNGIDGKAPFEERGDARQSGRSAGRLESIDCYRWPRIRSSILCYPILLHGAPPYAHSIVLSNRNALNSKRRFFCTRRRTVSQIRRKFPLLNSKENSLVQNLLGFSDYRYRLVDLRDHRQKAARSNDGKNTVSGFQARLSVTPPLMRPRPRASLLFNPAPRPPRLQSRNEHGGNLGYW
jgi:hypothetical protein